MATVISSIKYGDSSSDAESVEKKNDTTVVVSPLGKPFEDKRRFFWEKKIKNEDLNAIATQPSVYDNPVLAEKYQPRADWYVNVYGPSSTLPGPENNPLILTLGKIYIVLTQPRDGPGEKRPSWCERLTGRSWCGRVSCLLVWRLIGQTLARRSRTIFSTT